MIERAPSLQMMSQADSERLAKMVNEQPLVTREIWDQQIRLFEASGRDSQMDGVAVEDEVKKSPADLFVERWSAAFTRPTDQKLDADPRLAYLVQKHLK